MRIAAAIALLFSLQAHAADIETVVIVGINDFHGALAPSQLKDGKPAGGAASLAAQIKEIEARHPSRVLVLDAGDAWQGTLESDLDEGASVVQFYNALGVDAAAIGNHEFDFGPVGEGEPAGYDPLGALKARLAEARFTYLSANLVEKATSRKPEWPNLRASALLAAGRLKVGVIGLSTRSTPVTTRGKYLESLEFTELREATIREARALRLQGAHLVVAVAHAGLNCDLSHPLPPPSELTWKPKTRQPGCERRAEIVELLNDIPKGTVDGVIAGHTHQVTHHWIRGTPVIQSGAHGQYLSTLKFQYDMEGKTYLREKTEVTGPIPVGGRSDPATAKLLAEALERTAPLKARTVSSVARPVRHRRHEESEFMNLVSDAFRWKTGAELGLMNPGGVRLSKWETGPVSFEELYAALPFENRISVLRLTGEEVTTLVRLLTGASYGYVGPSGMTIEVLPGDAPAKPRDIDGDGKVNPWERDRIASVRDANGAPLDPKKLYTLATIDYLVDGSRQAAGLMKRIPKERVQLDTGHLMRETVEEYLKTRPQWNTEDSPLIDPSKPRLVFTKRTAKP